MSLQDPHATPQVAPRPVDAALLAAVAAALLGADALDGALRRCTDALVLHLDASLACVWTTSPDGAALTLVASSAATPALPGPPPRIAVATSVLGDILAAPSALVVDAIERDPRFEGLVGASLDGPTAFAGQPLRVGGRATGVLTVHTRHALPPSTRELLGAVADTIALGVERRELQSAAKASDAMFRALSEAMPVLAWHADPSGTIAWCNLRWAEFAPPSARTWLDACDPSTPAAVLDGWRAALAQATPWSDTVRLRRRDGAVRACLSRAIPERGDDGALVGWLGTHVDIDDQARAAEAQAFLAEAGAQLASSLDFATTLANVARLAVPRIADWCGVDVLAPDGTIAQLAVAHVDPSKVALAEELRRKRPLVPDAPNGVPAVIRSGRPEVYVDIPDELVVAAARDAEELALLRSLGLRSSMCVPLIAGGRTLGAISLVSAESGRRYDAADLAFAEELARRAAAAVDHATLYDEVRRLNATLERRVEERTAELREANRELETFSYTVSHDLRAPIRHMGGFVDLLERHAGDRLDEKGLRYVRTIGAAAKQMGALIDALLGFSRVGRSTLHRAPVDAAALVAEVRRDLQPDLEGRDIEWSIGPLPVILGDVTLLRLVFANLLGNAVKYTRPRAAAHISLTARTLDGGRAEFTLRDDGVGFRPEYTGKLFGVFQRLHADAQFEGTGIGLATVRRIIARHGGAIHADGAEGVGATFTFTLPTPEAATP